LFVGFCLQSLVWFLLFGGAMPLSVAAGHAVATPPSSDASHVPPDVGASLTTQEDMLAARVTARWDAMIRRDIEQAYEFLSPSYRALFPLEHMRRLSGRSVNWTSIDIESISIAGETANVIVTLHYRLTLPPQAGFGPGDDFGPQTKRIEEAWVNRDGEWWYVDPGGGRL
jgi:hypothetical protein